MIWIYLLSSKHLLTIFLISERQVHGNSIASPVRDQSPVREIVAHAAWPRVVDQGILPGCYQASCAGQARHYQAHGEAYGLSTHVTTLKILYIHFIYFTYFVGRLSRRLSKSKEYHDFDITQFLHYFLHPVPP